MESYRSLIKVMGKIHRVFGSYIEILCDDMSYTVGDIASYNSCKLQKFGNIIKMLTIATF